MYVCLHCEVLEAWQVGNIVFCEIWEAFGGLAGRKRRISRGFGGLAGRKSVENVVFCEVLEAWQDAGKSGRKRRIFRE